MSTRKSSQDTELVEVRPPRARPDPQRVAVSTLGMASTAHHCATDAAAEILEGGGNAVDAAVAAAFALGVCEPQASGLGGQSMLLIHHADMRKNVALDGSSRAPNRATAEALSPTERKQGYKATTVPSTPAVMDYALRSFGRLSLRDVLAPSIRLAEEGFEVSALQSGLMRREVKSLKAGNAASIFLHQGKRPFSAAARLQQPVLAATLRRLARRGVEDFYTGRISRQIHDDMVKNGGLIRRDDLAQIPWPIERRPLSVRFAGARYLTFPPPAAGRTLVEMLNILSQFPLKRLNPDTPEGALLLVEVIRRAFLDRQDRPFDPNFYPQMKGQHMVSVDYAKSATREIRSRIAKPPKTHGETTHLSVMDRNGNAVALTQSIERVFGAKVVTPDLGFLYNDYMSAFEYDDISHPYYLRPNAVPWASVAPTIGFRGRRPWVVIGSPGSERITPSIVQVLLRLGRQSPYEAVAAPRLHCRLDGTVPLEATRMRDDIVQKLEKHGYRTEVRDPYSFYLGCVQLVVRERTRLVGVADPRRDGSARGPRS